MANLARCLLVSLNFLTLEPVMTGAKEKLYNREINIHTIMNEIKIHLNFLWNSIQFETIKKSETIGSWWLDQHELQFRRV